jgi:nitric oxide dioxygenase
MTPEQVHLLRLSFVKLMGAKAKVGQVFYRRLFEIAPELRPLFKSGIEVQAQKLMDMLGIVIRLLRDPAVLSAMLIRLAQRHRGYGVHAEHYQKVRDALLWTLERVLAEAFTSELRTAWSELYDSAAAAMTQAANDMRAAPDSVIRKSSVA